MPTLSHTSLRRLGYAIFEAAGLPADQARIVTDHLVDANLTGHDSHGVIRIPFYTRDLRSGAIRSVENLKVVRETPASAVIDGDLGMGIVLAQRAMQAAVDRALKHTFGAVAVHRAGHIGRLGDFPPQAAERGCIGILILNGGSRFTVPFGGTAPRLPPNPIAISVPSNDGFPWVLDMTTSVTAGGKIDLFSVRNQPIPEGWLIDPEGHPVTDPDLFRRGKAFMLPLGGHKGYGLSVMIDAIAGALSWAGCSCEQPTRGGSGFLALAIKIESFIDLEDYRGEVQNMAEWIRSSPTQAGVEKIYLPGEVEEETRGKREIEGIALETPTWLEIGKVAEELGVNPEEFSEA